MEKVMQLGDVHFWGTVLIGILAGWLAHTVIGGRGGLIWNLIIGLIGSWIGLRVQSFSCSSCGFCADGKWSTSSIR
jgi:uncharacterized membrane protein YeaQ/YmgE (transglycosylase-associated protein family)